MGLRVGGHAVKVVPQGMNGVRLTGVRMGHGGRMVASAWPGETVRVTSYTAERVELEVVAEAAGYLVLTDAWYPGWQASVDGEPVPVHRADLLFRAVAVDPGRHQVVFTFRPASLWWGVGGSLAALAGLAIAVLALSKGKRSDIMDGR